MSYTCLLMVLRECACANLISKANFNLIDRTDLFICLHKMFQISFQNSKGQKSYRNFLGVRSELLLSIYVIMIMIHVMRFVRTWSITQKTGLLMTRPISTNVSSRFAQRFLYWQRFYNKYHTWRDIVSFTLT